MENIKKYGKLNMTPPDSNKFDANVQNETRNINSKQLLSHAKSRHGIMDAYPETITVTGSYACNYRCKMCNLYHDASQIISEKVIDEVIRVLPYAQLLRISGGEPLIFPYVEKLLRSAKKVGTKTMIFTNGSLLDKMSFDPARMIDEIIVSLDAATAKTYKYIRRANLQQVLKNVSTLTNNKDIDGVKPKILFNFVAMRSNINELEPLVCLAADMGVAAVGCVFLRVHNQELVNESLYFHQELSDNCMKLAHQTAKKKGVDLQLPMLFSDASKKNFSQAGQHQYCREPWKYLEINPHGFASVCCAGAGSEKIETDSSIETIWNSAKKQALRQTVNTINEPAICKSCAFGSVMDPSNPGSHFIDKKILEHVLDKKQRPL